MLLEISKQAINEQIQLEQLRVFAHQFEETVFLYLPNNVMMEVQVLAMDVMQAETLKQDGNELTLVELYQAYELQYVVMAFYLVQSNVMTVTSHQMMGETPHETLKLVLSVHQIQVSIQQQRVQLFEEMASK